MPDTSLFDLSGKVAAVSGAARGMGRAMATAIAAAGADMVLIDMNAEGLADLEKEISSMGRRVLASTTDVSDLEQIPALFSAIDDRHGRLDFLGNVAGGETVFAPPEELPIEGFQQSMQSLVVGRFLMCQEAGKRMLKQGAGSIVNIGSIGGVSSLGRGQIAYQAAMGAVLQMTRGLASEWASRGVRVNAILPAQVMNPGIAGRIERTPGLLETFLRGIPAGRLGQPNDIKGISVLLASDASSWITGAIIPMDGGNLALNAGGSYPGSSSVSG
jgi:NAD(P)-dependent dehydrogenase (short-subunit alcohol dehydrogenase family)